MCRVCKICGMEQWRPYKDSKWTTIRNKQDIIEMKRILKGVRLKGFC